MKILSTAEVPAARARGYDALLRQLEQWYTDRIALITAPVELGDENMAALPQRAVARYQEHARRLTAEVPEFAIWMRQQGERAAGRRPPAAGGRLPSARGGARPPGLVETELQRLSVMAFAMFHRLRLWVTTAELDSDLAGLGLHRQRQATETFRSRVPARHIRRISGGTSRGAGAERRRGPREGPYSAWRAPGCESGSGDEEAGALPPIPWGGRRAIGGRGRVRG